MKETSINIRVRKTDLDLIDRAAAIVGKSRSAFLREAAEADARRTFPALAGERCPLCGHITR